MRFMIALQRISVILRIIKMAQGSSECMQILARVKAQLESRGSRTIRGLGRTFRALDSYDGNRKLDPGELEVGLRENGCDLTKQEVGILFQYFDTDGDGTVNFDEFLVGIRGTLNQRRQVFVDKAFLKFDKDGNGKIEPADLRGVYDTSMHPKVISGEKTENDVFMEFLQSFGDRNGDGKIDRKEWNDYYAAVSASIDNDEHFVQLMRTAWKLDQ